jgi:hypothetical protein
MVVTGELESWLARAGITAIEEPAAERSGPAR